MVQSLKRVKWDSQTLKCENKGRQAQLLRQTEPVAARLDGLNQMDQIRRNCAAESARHAQSQIDAAELEARERAKRD
jgi:hypothetical protein